MRVGRFVFAAAVLAGAAAAGLFVYQHRPLSVSVVAAEPNVPIVVFGLGTVEARLLTKIGFKVAGTLVDLKADHGDRVRAGQALARLDDGEQAAKVAKAEAQRTTAEASVHVAEAAATKADALLTQRSQTNLRRQTLLARQAVSIEAAEEAQLNEGVARADLLVARSEVASAKSRLDDARAQHAYEQVILAQHELRAPFDGIIVQRAKELGAVMAPGESLFTLVDPQSVWLLAYVDEARAGEVALGQPVEVRLRSLPQRRFRGRVVRIGIESDRVNEERRVYVGCDDCPEAFFLGEQAEAFIDTGALRDAVMVPENAIEKFDGARGTVWTVEDGKLARRTLAFGRRSLDGRVEVTSGLPSGARIVQERSVALREGRAATIRDAARP